MRRKDLAQYNERELKQVKEDQAYWNTLAALIPGWELMGFTNRDRATYVTPGHWNKDYTDSIQMTGTQRDMLVQAILSTYPQAGI